MKVREAAKLLEKNGWIHVRTKGSHRIFKKTVEGRNDIIVLPGADSAELAIGTWNSIKKKAEIE